MKYEHVEKGVAIILGALIFSSMVWVIWDSFTNFELDTQYQMHRRP